jgi:site-specific DNA recombinase
MTRKLAAVPDPARTAVVYTRVSTKEQAERDGDPEGYSIPAQREACRRKAASLEAQVVAEFVDRGESARSADRPELQRMLRYLREQPVDYVIVHKLDRLARSRADDVAITAAIVASGSRLISVTENIDETPSGYLLQGIMSSINEFYSRNLANEVIKGTQQKVRGGGTPSKAPIGYLNVRKVIDGYELRTVELDPERAELVRWAFEAYATGDWSLRSLADELESRGLTFRPTRKQPERPVPLNKLQQILRSRYYIGYVTWRGVEYEGKHPKLVDAETFLRVQQMLDAHRASGERSYKRDHYLAGTLRCGRCRRRLLYTMSRGSKGQWYGYFYCASRSGGGRPCGLRYLPARLVEEVVEHQWLLERVPAEDMAGLRDDLWADYDHHEKKLVTERKRLQTRIHAIKRERLKWAQKAMDGVVPDDIARDQQQRLAGQLLTLESQLAQVSRIGDAHRQSLTAILDLIERCGEAYQQGDEKLRRALNQAWWDFLDMDEDESGVRVASRERQELTAALQAAIGRRRKQPHHAKPGSPQRGYRVVGQVGSSNVACLVELRGVEPRTSSMRTKRATNCATAPSPVRIPAGASTAQSLTARRRSRISSSSLNWSSSSGAGIGSATTASWPASAAVAGRVTAGAAGFMV